MSDSPKICSVVTEETVDGAREAIWQAATVADLVELRLDYLRDFDFRDVAALEHILEGKPLPVIITCRSFEEGGQQRIDDEVRLKLLVEGARRSADYCDIEAAHYAQASALYPDISRLTVSYHNFEETPVDLDLVYDRVTSLPAAVHKIVTRANRLTDNLAIFRLLKRSSLENKQLIAIAMGPLGIVTRLLGNSRGSFLTYGSRVHGKESAEGQPTCEELIDLYRIRRLNVKTVLTGIIGSPIGHSASPEMHNRAFGDLGLDYIYLPLEVTDVAEFFNHFLRPATSELGWDIRGFSVTIPHKSSIIPLLDQVDDLARTIGAVNTVVLEQGKWIGYNTDVDGAMQPLEQICNLSGEQCAVIGAGGAARAVTYGLLKRGADVEVFARNPRSANLFSESFGISVSSLESLQSSDAAVVINTTPVGMRGHSEGSSPVPAEALRGRKVVYDLVYNPLDTEFLRDARAAGCQTISGIEMLIAQAALQFELWTGRKPTIEKMREAALSKVLA